MRRNTTAKRTVIVCKALVSWVTINEQTFKNTVKPGIIGVVLFRVPLPVSEVKEMRKWISRQT
jgi:hypothetical protein